MSKIIKPRNYKDTVKASKTYKGWQKKNKELERWKGSTFECYRFLGSPKSKGAEGEKMVHELMEEIYGHEVLKAKGRSAPYDRIINGIKTEIKSSSSWGQDDDCFTWQQLRELQDYERVIFMGVNPESVYFWWCTKKDLEKHVFSNDRCKQHGGKDGEQELYWLNNIFKMDWFRDIETF